MTGILIKFFFPCLEYYAEKMEMNCAINYFYKDLHHSLVLRGLKSYITIKYEPDEPGEPGNPAGPVAPVEPGGPG